MRVLPFVRHFRTPNSTYSAADCVNHLQCHCTPLPLGPCLKSLAFTVMFYPAEQPVRLRGRLFRENSRFADVSQNLLSARLENSVEVPQRRF